ncbi:MAG TPA: AI-2E family transporter [Saprospiraceae bacterium]|nr:AI-2E family transporter [Saprospiraceae bacterium]
MVFNSSSVLNKLLVLFFVFAGIYYAKDILMPLAIGTVLATLFLPVSQWLENKKVPRIVAAFVCLSILLLLITGVLTMLKWQISQLTQDIDLIKQKGAEMVTAFRDYLAQHANISLETQSELLGEQQPFITRLLQEIPGSLSYVLIQSIFILVYMLLLLYYRSHFKQFLLKLATPEQKSETENVIYSIAHVSQQYLIGLSKMIVCLWIMYGIGFSLLGVKNALFFAFLCGILEIVPFIGNITGTTITVLVAALQGASLPLLAGIVGTYAFVQFIQGWVLEPLIVGSQVKINALFTIVALAIGELLWGISGIFLAIPLIAMFKIACDHIESLKPIGYLIGENEPKNK